MDERPDKIVEQIKHERNSLGRNLDELQNRLRDTTDWRVHFDRHPMTILGVAMGGGLLLGAVVAGSRRSHGSSRGSRSYARSSYSGLARDETQISAARPLAGSASAENHGKGMEVLDNIKGAVFGYAATQARQWLDQVLPGFSQHYEESASRKQSPPGRNEQRSRSEYGWGEGKTPHTTADLPNQRQNASREPMPAL